MTAHVEGYYKNPQENFEHAYDLIINTQSHDELICMLKAVILSKNSSQR